MKDLRKRFRCLVGIYIAILILGVFMAEYTRSIIPDYVADGTPSFLSNSVVYLICMLFVVLAVILLKLVALVGLLCLWPPAKYIFTVAVVLKIVSASLLYRFDVITGIVMMIGSLELLLDGGIITLFTYGPVRHLYRGRRR